MTRIVFLNGDYVPEHEAKISIFDRAVNFGDAIYEVAGVLDGKLIDFEHHMQRYFNSLEKLSIESPLEQTQILEAFRRLVELNQIEEGLVYMQVTRGVAERDFVWPKDITPNVFMFTQPKASIEHRKQRGRDRHYACQHSRHSLGTTRYQVGKPVGPGVGQASGA
jgi:D-alanine transaminase